MRLSLDETGLVALDALRGIDALCLFISEDERPLRGMAGFVDWRLLGSLSNILRSEHFVGARGDQALVPILRGLAVQRAFCFGLGPKASFHPANALGDLMRTASNVLDKAGCRSVALELPGLTEDNCERLIDLFIEHGLISFSGEAIVLLGAESRNMARALQKASDRLRRLQVQFDDRAAQSIIGLKRGV